MYVFFDTLILLLARVKDIQNILAYPCAPSNSASELKLTARIWHFNILAHILALDLISLRKNAQ